MKLCRIPAILFLVVVCSCSRSAQWQEGSLKDIKPSGWLLDYLETQRTGLTGHPEALSYPYNTCLWNGDIPRMGTHGRVWWRYEQTAYYTDGLLRLGYLLGDEQMSAKAEDGIRYTFAHQQPDGWLGNRVDENSWPMAVFFRAIKAAYDASPDPAVLEALERYYTGLSARHLAERRNILALEGMLWLYSRNGDHRLVDKADSVFRYRNEILGPDAGKHRDSRVTVEFLTGPEPYNMHGVTMSETLKLPVMLYQATGDTFYRDLAVYALDRLYEEDGLPDGLFTSAEWLKGRDIMHSHETCNAIDMSWTLGYFLEILKDARYADMLEKIVFNAGMGSVTEDFKALQYYSSVNQFICTGTSNHNADNYGSTWMAYRPTHQTECCAGQIHRMMPNYAARMWLRSSDGVVAALYGPSSFKYSEALAFVEETSYPYDETVAFRVEASAPERLTLTLRIPGWCKGAGVKVNGKPLSGDASGLRKAEAGSFVQIRRTFRDGDVVELELPMETRRCDAFGGGVWFERGPLVYAYPIPSLWTKDTERYANMNGKYPADDNAFPCWSITPNGPWNYAMTETSEAEFVQTPDGPRLRVPVVPVEWQLFESQEGKLMTPPLPEHAVAVGDACTIELIPYGQTELRLTVFPVVE